MRHACSEIIAANGLLILLHVWCVQGYARRAAEEHLDPGQGFTVDLALKDVR
jgi:hypothetical protein